MSPGTIEVTSFHGYLLSHVTYARLEISHSEYVPVFHLNFDRSRIENKQTSLVAVRVQFSLEDKRMSACMCEIKKERIEKWVKKRER